MKRRVIVILVLLAGIIALPVGLRRKSETASRSQADDSLVIITPHNESIRHEFGEAFARHWKAETGRTLHLDWRTPGGASEIRLVLDAGFSAATETGHTGIGIDVLFGGGAPDFTGQAKQGRLVPLEVFRRHPSWFGESATVPESFTGEMFFPADRTWVGACLSQFGICYNPDVLARLGLSAPETWRDLADPRYAGALALSDPTKSGSVARAFELIVQSEMQRAAREIPGRDSATETGWRDGLRLIQRLAANSRYFTDSASKIPQDVGNGNAAAGMCIDFYGRSFAAELDRKGKSSRLVWIAPAGGTTLSADPVAVLKGAPHPEIAQRFVEFCLSPAGQQLWFAKPGSAGGPMRHALHRIPIRRDVFTPENAAISVLPPGNPYSDPANFTYDAALTGKAFNTLRNLVKTMCIDSHDEMKAAWREMRAAGMPRAAVETFGDVSLVPYAKYGGGNPEFDGSDALATADASARIGGWFRGHYRRAKELAAAEGGRK